MTPVICCKLWRNVHVGQIYEEQDFKHIVPFEKHTCVFYSSCYFTPEVFLQRAILQTVMKYLLTCRLIFNDDAIIVLAFHKQHKIVSMRHALLENNRQKEGRDYTEHAALEQPFETSFPYMDHGHNCCSDHCLENACQLKTLN